MTGTYITKNSKETKELAKELAKTLSGSEIIALYGDLGAGKTTFAQGLIAALDIKRNVISPTFIIHRSYAISSPAKKGAKHVHHIDLYRIRGEKELSGLGLEDLMEQHDAITIIEWPEKMGSLLPVKRIEVRLDYIDESQRRIIINSHE